MTVVRIERALLSVSDKAGLVDLARALHDLGVELLSTGGSATALRLAGLPVTEVADHTGFPEVMDGRVKTLHPRVHGGILARRDVHADEMAAHGIPPIDLVVSNLYPFESTVLSGADVPTCVENIDIGGPAMVRAAAKNHDFVVILTSPVQYEDFLAELGENDGGTTHAFRRRCAQRAFAHTAAYDAVVSNWLADQIGEAFPPTMAFAGRLRQPLRYGENPHQRAAFYADPIARSGIATATQVQGKELSYNNLNDTDAAFELAAEFDRPAVVIVKHANPCGAAVADAPAEAYRRALRCDPVSAFGGIIALNRPLDRETAELIAGLFAEVVIAPDADADACAALAAKKNLRLLLTGGMPDPAAPGRAVRSVAGGYLVQSRDGGRIEARDLQIVTRRAPTDAELADLLFAFRVAKHVKSNAIVYAKDGATVGVGAGQMSRVDSARIAAWKGAEAARLEGLAEPLVKGSVVASDAFFPFADGLLAAAEAGATAVIQPGGSVRDQEVIAAADEKGLAMVFTGMRHFRH